MILIYIRTWIGLTQYAKDHASNQRVTVDISGGTEILRYSFVAAAYNERGILNVTKSDEWDPSIKLQRYNVRSNVDLKAISYYTAAF